MSTEGLSTRVCLDFEFPQFRCTERGDHCPSASRNIDQDRFAAAEKSTNHGNWEPVKSPIYRCRSYAALRTAAVTQQEFTQYA